MARACATFSGDGDLQERIDITRPMKSAAITSQPPQRLNHLQANLIILQGPFLPSSLKGYRGQLFTVF